MVRKSKIAYSLIFLGFCIAFTSIGLKIVVRPEQGIVPRMAALSGQFIFKWGGQSGVGDGQFNLPGGIAINSSGFVYIADTKNHRIQVFTPTGQFLFKWGKSGGDGTSGTGNGEFLNPCSIAINSSGYIYVADTDNHRVQVFTSTGQFLFKWGKNGGDGTSGSNNGEFQYPTGIAVNGSNCVYVVDSWNTRVEVFSLTGQYLFQWGSPGSGDGSFTTPREIEVNGSGCVHVTDTGNHRVEVFTITGQYLSQWGSSGAVDGKFSYPWGIAINETGNIYIGDTENNRVQEFTLSGNFLRKWGAIGSSDGQLNFSSSSGKSGIAVNGTGQIYVVDTGNNRIQVFSIIDSGGTTEPPNWTDIIISSVAIAAATVIAIIIVKSRKKRAASPKQVKSAKLQPILEIKPPQGQGVMQEKALDEVERTLLDKFKSILAIAQRVSLADVSKSLGMARDALFEHLIVWKKKYNLVYKIDGDFLVIEEVSNFISALDKQFAEWGTEGKKVS